MLRAFKNIIDIHNTTAAEIFNVNLNDINNEQHRYVKTIIFV